MLTAEKKDFITSSSIKYAVINQDRSISYEVHGCRSSLCDDSDSTSMSTTSTTSGIATNSCNHGGATVNGSSTNAVGVYIGVAVGLLCAVGAVVVIIVLWRRLRSKHDKTNSETRDCACKSNATYEDEVQNHNYFILEKCAHLVDKSEDHKDTAYEPNKGNAQTDTYNSIDEAEEHYQSIKDEYDYTNNALPNKRKPDNVYNKLKQDLPGNYAHVKRPGQTITKAGSDYDTTAVAPRNDGDGDYNHIPHPDRTTCARRNGSNDDYDVINGKKIQFPPIDSADYAHVKV
ncbi:uncharacterized protein LOC127861175 isoform X2 [Dreissena polymorpha]|uniref:uncharacterized protein LOC127861175 isoform X2 n=1 Tax=Dreissena polymorpha TaxID=45954 RepID=UPI0022649F50|nr:uncharacterized protein LOC127861175 isoform X2 [Dreissena polymorpha]